ncbi:MAG TPA: cyclic nucleotide-binding domain-containing protein [Chloroflexota bacterium]|nr:cyclic nucleotide-binding domain-containing protein [Chloroflexota bacterium]
MNTAVNEPVRHLSCQLRAIGALSTVEPARLAQIPLLASLGPAELEVAAIWVGVERHPAEAVIVRQGETADRMFLIAGGKVEVLVNDARGVPRRVSALSAGSYFGEIALLGDDSARRTATVRSIAPVELYSLQKDDFRILLRSQPRIARDVARLARVRLEQSRQIAGA